MMAYKRPDCTKCYGFGYIQIYLGGKVKRVHCSCEAGIRAKEREKK